MMAEEDQKMEEQVPNFTIQNKIKIQSDSEEEEEAKNL